MKNMTLIFLYLFVFSSASLAQLKTDLGGNVLKKSDQNVAPPISINDFSFQPSEQNNDFIGAQRTKPGVAFLSSIILPGSAQAANGKWKRAGIYLATEAFSIFYYINRTNTAKRQEQRYKDFANSEWSVVAYSQWLVGYYDNNPGASNTQIEELRNMVGGLTPDFDDSRNDWNQVDIRLLQSIERSSPLICQSCNSGNKFSHVLPAYGSQQYYELISKYYQFEGGWSDFYSQNVAVNNPNYSYQYDNNGSLASDFFFLGAERADQFNNNYRRAGNILNVLVINHVVSAFDALFTVKLKNAQIEPSANMMRPDSFSLTLHF